MKSVKQTDILTGSIPKQLLLFFLPIWFGTLFQQLYNTADTLIVGNFVGTNALAAVGATGPFVNLLVGLFVGLCSGAGVVIAQSWGAHDPDAVDRQVHTALGLRVAVGALLTVLGDWQGIGVANMNDTQTTQFAKILAHAVEKYGLDGIGFDDEYANYSSTNSTSYSEIITKLHALMPADKLITVFDWGYTNTLNSEAKACIDYAYHGYFGSSFMTSGLVDKTRWSPVSTNLGSAPNAATLNSLAKRAKAQGYGAFMFFNLRRSSNVNPLNGFNATASGLYGLTVTCENGDRPQDWTFVSSGYEINMDEVE